MIEIDKNDIYNLCSSFEDKYLDLLQAKQTIDSNELCSTITTLLYDFYKLNNTNDSIVKSITYYIDGVVPKVVEEFIKNTEIKYKSQENKLETFMKLKQLQLPEQRSKEWYEIREGIVTASSLADALGKGHFQTRDELLFDKSRKDKKPFVSHWIMEWGVKYEDVAIQFYESITGAKIMDFGLVPHPKLKVFGASPDGICDETSPPKYIGRMLEIKCPPKRVFTKEVPEHYWMQMQGQLETCDLDECDFLQVKITEYNTIDEYIQDTFMIDDKIVEGMNEHNLPKGSTLTFTSLINDQRIYEYKYCPLYQSTQQIMEWAEKTTYEYKQTNPEKQYKVSQEFWKIERYECTLVLRDRNWWLDTVPNIINFWSEVVYYRQHGTEELEKRINDRKNKYRRKKKTPTQDIIDYSQNKYSMDSDSD